VLFRAWQQRVAALLDDVPHGGRGYQILQAVAQGSPPTQAELAAHLGIDRTVLTYVLDDLVAAGVLERRTDDADRRVRRLALTGAGIECLHDLDARVAAAEDAMLAGLPDGHRAGLADTLGTAALAVHSGPEGEHECTIVREILGSYRPPLAAS
jgi:DNA-binding MarR family transcriptional regulator